MDGRPAGNGLDVVSGWKRVRHDPWHKVLPSRVFNGMVGLLTGVRLHDHNCGMKCYRAEIFREVRLYGELHRFIPVLAAARGFRVGEIEINHRPRKFGQSKYGVRRFIKGFLDLLTVKFLTGFGRRPQHLLGSVGLVCFPVGRPRPGLPRRDLDNSPLAARPVSAAARTADADLRPGRTAVRRADDDDRLSRRTGHRLAIGRHDDVYSVRRTHLPAEQMGPKEEAKSPLMNEYDAMDQTETCPPAALLAADRRRRRRRVSATSCRPNESMSRAGPAAGEARPTAAIKGGRESAASDADVRLQRSLALGHRPRWWMKEPSSSAGATAAC